MRLLLLAAALTLAACDDGAQKSVDEAEYICKDGVEYFVYTKISSSGVGYSVVPHFKPDGTLYTCERKVK